MQCFFIKLGKIKIGGENAIPKFSRLSWFSLSLTTTCASGILFWGMAEPIDYISNPPTEINGIVGNTPEAVSFAIETIYTHWTFMPYAIYTLPTIVFAFMYYNGKKKFDITTFMAPVLGKFSEKNWMKNIFSILTLFCICGGMAGSIGQVLINLSGGINSVTGEMSEKIVWLFLTIVIIIITSLCVISEINKGIKFMSNVNVVLYVVFLGAIIIFGPTLANIDLWMDNFVPFLKTMVQRATVTGYKSGSYWPKCWTMFYWASWMAWMPTTSIFLARLSYGRTIRASVGVNLLANAIVMTIWMSFMSGTAINFQINKVVNLANEYSKNGPKNIPYMVLEKLDGAEWLIPLFIIIIVITIVTACNSNVSVMAGLCSTGISSESPEPSKLLKILWAVMVPLIAFIMVSEIGIDGVKIIANFGGLVAMVIMFFTIISFIEIVGNYKNYDKT